MEGSNGTARQLLFWLLGSLASVLVVLMGVVIADNRAAIAALQADMKERSADRYHASEARADFAVRDRRLDACEAEGRELRHELDVLTVSAAVRHR